MFYSKSTGGFYDINIHGNNIPADAVEITPECHASLLAAQSIGQRIEADATGFPVAVEHVPTADELTAQKTAALAQARQLREIALDRLGGLAGRADRAGDPATAAACDAAAVALLTITDVSSVIAATDGPSTQAALTIEWRNIAATLAASAPSAVSVFVGLGL